jgi:hypothetical protein
LTLIGRESRNIYSREGVDQIKLRFVVRAGALVTSSLEDLKGKLGRSDSDIVVCGDIPVAVVLVGIHVHVLPVNHVLDRETVLHPTQCLVERGNV